MLTNMPSIRYELPRPPVGWELGETLPSSLLHDEIVTLLRAILTHWAARFHPQMLVARELAVRWDRERPANGVDPDVAVFPARPPGDLPSVRSMCTWKEGHVPPLFAIEVVSDTEPRKDYTIAPDKYAASGVRELVVFDPMLSGPRSHGGPFLLQVWRRDEKGAFVRVHAGDGPASSEALGAHLVVFEGGEAGRRLRLAGDAGGQRLWLTAEEEARAEKEAARAAEEAARARIAELEAQLEAARRGVE
jgi:Uma2 family endonuclease